ncbi:uncharacterized protein LOC111063497 isoform X2 [Nilaparvata lugens]|uniref:uncharacterized protein LOC111063497 isoform X2 n=1 Tax=Nilaparvata lugens TaxID=108931 RepID=UPI00193C8EDF|nr:uncharacterized protein LOC111063497 isoform X2 [Nilaparvata lugens]
MRLLGLLVLSVSIAASTLADEDWSWGSSSEKKSPSKDSNTDSSSAHAQLSATVVDDIIDGGRGGRQLEGFDDVYSDPDVQQALSAGNDSQARHYIKERLCGLGLMACDDEIEEKRPHVHPQDLIYAQPVHLKPVGRPITAIPIKGGSPVSGPGYGPPRPVPLPGYGGRPPPPFSSGPSHKPSYYGGGPPPPPYRGGSGPGPVFAGSKPSAVFEPEPDFHYNRPLQGAADEKKVVVVNSQSDKVQHHVHHHFHHDADKNAADASFVPPAAIESPVYPPLGPVSYSPSGASGSLYPSNSIPGSSYAGSYNGVNTGPFYKKELNLKGGYSTNNYVTQSAASFNNYPKYETPRADGGFGDCICVPYDQCPPHEIARKEDGYFIDPRTVSGATIEALGPDDVVVTDGNGTMTVVSKHSKRDDSEAKSNDDEITKSTENADESGSKAEPETSRRKREAAVDTNESTERKNVKPRKFGLGGTSGADSDDDSDSTGLKLRPTFGVSFGLPSGGGGYPLNPFHHTNPALNPYGGALGGSNGLDLGLVSVNPLLSVQVQKDEFGDKVVKPLVNLHVTPNHGFVHKIGSIFHKFKEPFYYAPPPPPPPFIHQHQHFHNTQPPKYGSYPKPYGAPPPFYGPKPWGPGGYSHYAPSYQSYRQDKYSNYAEGGGINGFKGSSYLDPVYDTSYTRPQFNSYQEPQFTSYQDNTQIFDDDSYDGYYRSANGGNGYSNTTTSQTSFGSSSPSSSFVTSPSSSSVGGAVESRSPDRVQFPSDRRKDVAFRDDDGDNVKNDIY